MTGYGTATGKVGRGRFYVEIKTVNHRYCEVAFKIPSRMGSLESPLRESLQSHLKRGRVEFFLKELEPIFGATGLILNVELAKQYQKALKRLQKTLKISGELDTISLLGMDHFVQARERAGSYVSHFREIQKLVYKALEQVKKMRYKEGGHLLKDQKKRLKSFSGFLSKIEVRGHANIKKHLNQSKGQQVNGNESNSILDKIDISEELTRLKSHTKQYAELMNSKGLVGRKLDFLIQEMHREINTIGAKAADAKISRYIVESKSLLENLREQVQNIL